MNNKTENMVAREVASLINRTKFEGVRPMKPKKSDREDLTEAEKLRLLADAYEIYEDQKKDYDQSRTEHNQKINRLHDIMIEKAFEENLPESFPKDLAGKIWSKAYEDRHSEGYFAVLDSFEEDAELYVEIWWRGITEGTRQSPHY